jgi:hypothetical protein
LVGTDSNRINEWVKTVGAEKHQIVQMNLEDQFIEYTAPPSRGKLFRWEEI